MTTQRTIEGLSFTVYSPASWEWNVSLTETAAWPFWRVLLEYTGECWNLVVHLKSGNVARRPFASRDAIIDLLKQRQVA